MPRADKEKNDDMIAAEYAKNPLATVREVAEATGVSKSTVASHKHNLDKVGQKDPRILALTDADLEIIVKAQWIINEKLSDDQQVKKMNIRDVSSVAKDSSARYTLFRWKATDNEWWLNVISELDLLD